MRVIFSVLLQFACALVFLRYLFDLHWSEATGLTIFLIVQIMFWSEMEHRWRVRREVG
jgi:hypothetical protein